MFRHAQNGHDDPQGIPDGHIFDKVTLTTKLTQPVYIQAGQFVDTRLQLAQVGTHEPPLGQDPVLHVIRIIHLDERAHQMSATGQLLHDRLRHFRAEYGSGVVDEYPLLPLHFFDVVITREVPDWSKAFRCNASDWVMCA